MASSGPPYVYTPLPSPTHTRIVELLPAAYRAAHLICRLVTLDLDDDDDDIPPCYEALSYTWGQPVFSERLFIRGPNDDSDIRVLQITASLASALRGLRRGDAAVRRVWADAVCINQGDTAEKGRQIPLMSIIYRGASRVVVWLDPGETIHVRGGGSEARARRLNTLIRRHFVRREVLQGGALDGAKDLLEEHFTMPWFSRRWIIQEVVGHPDVELLCGEEKTGWLPLMALATSVFGDVKAAPAVVTSVLMMYDLWRMWVVGEPRSGKCRLMKLLGQFEHFGCTDDRDRIYALVGLAEDGYGDDAFVPTNMDYSVSAERLYIKFAEELVGAGYLPWVLQQACARRCTNKGGLPSWVPDWRVPPATKTLWEAPAWKCRASVEQFGSSVHALTANLGSVKRWKPWAEKRDAFPNGRRFWGGRLTAGDWQMGEYHIDGLPLQVEWKNGKEYPHGGGASVLRKWILETAHEGCFGRQTGDIRNTLQELLVEGCHSHIGRYGTETSRNGPISGLHGPEAGSREKVAADTRMLIGYVRGSSLTVEVKRLVRDLDTLMAGRCIFSCRIRSPPSIPTPTPPSTSTVIVIGPSETRVGDRVISFQFPDPPERDPKAWPFERFWGYSYVVRDQLVQTASIFPSMQAQIPSSQPEITGFRLVGDCFLLGSHLEDFIMVASDLNMPGACLRRASDSDSGTMGLFLC
jgi:hypothetical protein